MILEVVLDYTVEGVPVMPRRASAEAAGLDISCPIAFRLRAGEFRKVMTGVKVSIPVGFVGLLFPRSGLGTKGLSLANTVGVIDSDYQGDLTLMLRNTNPNGDWIDIAAGDRVAQLVIIPCAKPDEIQVDNFSRQTERGEKGFGSTGVKS